MIAISKVGKLSPVVAAAALWSILLLAGDVRAVQFEFAYADPGGQGFFDPVLGESRRAAVEYAGSRWGSLIPSAYAGETITVIVSYADLGLQTRASTPPGYLYPAPTRADTHFPKALANHLSGTDVDPDKAEISIQFNSNPAFGGAYWYYGLDGNPSPTETDYVSTAFHEIGHGLGFSVSLRQNGSWGLFGDGLFNPDVVESGLPTIYDQFLTRGPNGTRLLDLPQDQRVAALVSSNVFWNGVQATAANGGTPVEIWAPNPYQIGSTLSHVDHTVNATTANAVMQAGRPAGVAIHSPLALERAMLRDLGWNLSISPSSLSWSGLGADNSWTTPGNWALDAPPRGGDTVSFGASPQTDVAVRYDGGFAFFNSLNFQVGAPAYTLRFKAQTETRMTGAGILNFSSQPLTIFLESAFRDDLTPSLTHSAAALTLSGTANAGNADYHVRGGGTSIAGIAPPHGTYYFDRYPGASVAFEGNATAGTASFEIEAGSGDGGPNAQVTFRNNSTASGAEFRTKGGRLGPSLPFGSVAVGFGGQVRFEDTSKAGSATFHNEGQAEAANGGGGFTIFTDDSNADNAEIHNHGATYLTGYGGATYFEDRSTAGSAMITNHADGSNHVNYSAQGRTIFVDDSNAGTAIIENEGAPSQSQRPGRTEFHNNASAAGATINNRGYKTVGDLAGRTLFYDDTTAANATLRTFNGYSDHGRIEFRDRSTAADANIFIDNDPMVTASRGGYLIFYNDSTAARSDITLRASTGGYSGIQFYDKATAADAQIVGEDSSGNIIFWGNSSAGDPLTADTPEWANFSLGRGNLVSFYDQSTADDAHFTLADRAQIFFQMNSSAGHAQIAAAGGSVYTASPGATITFNSNSTADNATVFVNGASAPLASPAAISVINGAHAANATFIANGGTNGGLGATISFSNAYGDDARIIAHAGSTVDFLAQPTFNNGSTSVGSIDGAGKFVLRGSHLIAGSQILNSTVSGPIVDNPTPNPFYSGGRLTKVGTGTLTLAGANTYSGLTTVSAGTLRLTGSIAGDVQVNAGARIEVGGPIAGRLDVAPGGVWAPGSSPGTATLGGLNMGANSILDFEIGATRDHIVLANNGNVTLDGILNVSFLDGFTPTLGQTFPLFEGAVGSVTGAFDAVIAPVFNGLTLNLVQNASSVMLQAGPPTLLAADFNGDGSVTSADLTNWRGGFGTAVGAARAQGNADADADVDGFDFLVWQRQLGAGPSQIPASPAVPEPASAIVLVLGLLGVVGRSRRKAALGGAAAFSLALAAPAMADYAVQDNVAFNAKKINPYTGGPAWVFSDTYSLLDESFGPVTIGPLDADPLGLAVEALFGVDLPHLVKLKAGASASGHATVNFGYYVTAGRLDISYPASASLNFQTDVGTTNVVQANQNYGINGVFMPGVSQRTVQSQFLTTQGGVGYATAPLRSQTEYQTPWFETQSPWASAWVEASANVQSSIFTKASALGGLKEWRKDIQAGGNVGGRLVEIDPTGLYLLGDDEPQVGFDLTQPIGPIPIGGGAADLTIRVPNIAVSSVTNGNVQGAVIHARKEQPLVTVTGNLERLIPFVGTILQNNIGPLGYDLLNLAGGPQLTLYQDMTFTPDPKVRLTFSEPVIVPGNSMPTSQAEFDLDAPFSWKPMFSNSSTIQVTPTYLLNNTFRNETGLQVDFVMDVEALSLTGDFPPFNGTLGPVYDETVTVPIFTGGELFAPQFNIPLGSVTGGSVPGIGPITTGAITFQKSNLGIVPGLGDMQLFTSTFVSSDPNNSDIQTHDLTFTRAVAGSQPRQYQARVTGLFGMVDPEGDNVGAYLLSPNDVIVTDPDTGDLINLGKNFSLYDYDLSALQPAPSPAYIDPNPNLGKLYVTTLPDDLTFVPNVDLNVTGHQVLDQYNASDDIKQPQDSTLPGSTEFIDRAAYPDSTILARKGQVIPDGIGRFNGFNSVTINESGDLAFSSSLTLVPSGAGVNGFYFLGEAGVSKLARAGDPIPGATGTMTFFGGPVALNDVGQAALLLGMSNSFSNSLVVRNGPGGLKVLARNGQTAPGGGTFQDFVTPALNNSGQVLFWSRVVLPNVGTDEVLYISDGAALSEIAREGDSAPGMPGLMSSFGYYSLNNGGQTSFDVYTTGNVQGLYIRDPNGILHLIAADGGAVPQGGEFAGINDQDLNDAGQVAFAAGLRTSPGGPFKFGIFRGDASSLVQIAREGQLAPDGDGTLKSTGLFSFQVNDAGQVVFRGSVDAATDYQAILLGDGGNLVQIARGGTPAPGGNGQITELAGFPQLNNHGHVAFNGVIGDPEDEGRSVFLYDGVNIVPVVRVGQPLAGSTVVGADAAGINDNMQVAYSASLADGRSVVARFEPSIYWSKNVSGNWGTANNWSLGIEPRDPYDVIIVAENAITVAGPNANRTVKSLTLGADDSANVRLHLASGVTLTATNGTTIRPNGLLTGHGTLVGSVTNEGAVSPGSSPGTLTIDGDFTQLSAGTLVIEMASASDYDRLLASGDITLGGTLAVSLLNGFTPIEGQQFSIFGTQFDSISGAFQSFNFPTFNGLTFAASQSLNSIVLEVVEAPLSGDFNADHMVDGADLTNWKSGFGTAAGATRNAGDDNGDGDVDGADFLAWQRQFSPGPGATSAAAEVPEPSTVLPSVLGATILGHIASRLQRESLRRG